MPPPGARENTIQSEVGDQRAEPTGSVPLVTWMGQPPSLGTTQICGVPLRSETNAICVPSGEKLGELARPTAAMRVTSVSTDSEAQKGTARSRQIASSRARRMAGLLTACKRMLPATQKSI